MSTLNTGRVDALVHEAEIARRKAALPPFPVPPSQSPWQELYLQDRRPTNRGAVIEEALKYRQIGKTTPRHNH